MTLELDAARPILDGPMFDRICALLAPDALDAYLGTIAERSEAILRTLQGAAPGVTADEALADAVHALGGSAGMFGCKRLAETGQRFEHGLRTAGADIARLADEFRAAVDASMRELRRHRLRLVEPGALQN